MKKVVVTGGAGFIGSHLVDKLIEQGKEVHIFDDMSMGSKDNINPKAYFHKIDISTMGPKTLAKFMVGVDTVFHVASRTRVQPSIKNPSLYHRVNVTGTLNMLIASVKAGVKRFVYSASSSAYGESDTMPLIESMPTNPMSPYGLSKLMGEEYCKLFNTQYGLETVNLRYFNVYGERQNIDGGYCLVMGIFAKQRLAGEHLTIVGDGEQRRDFTYVGDVVKANIAAATSDKVGLGEVINIGNGDNRSVNQIAEMIGGNKLHIQSRVEPKETLASIKKGKELLNWEPTQKIEDWMPKYKKELGI
jgi:nucleoside-diphosphate-sugar epimerase